VDEYKSRLSAYLSDMVREELEKYDGGFTDEWNDQRKKNAEVLGYKLSGKSDIKEAVKDPKLKVGQKIRHKNDPRKVYTLKKITHGNRGIPEDPAGTSYMFVASGNRKEYHTKKTWAQAIKKGWIIKESVNEKRIKNSPLRRNITSTFKDLDKKFRKKLTSSDIDSVASYITSKNRYFPKELAIVAAEYFYEYKRRKLKINQAIQATINYQRGYPYKSYRTGTELESVNEGFTKYHIRLTDTPGWYGVWDKKGKQKFEGDRRFVTKHLKKLKTRMGNYQLKSLIDVATKRKGKDITFDVVESINEAIKPQGYSQLNTMAKHAGIYIRDLLKALRKQDDNAVIREVHFLAAQFTTMEKMLKDKKWNAKYSESVNEAGMGILTTDQSDVLQGIVLRNKNKNLKAILKIVLKDPMFKGVDKKELLGYIDGARQFVKYMKSHPMESVNEDRDYKAEYKKYGSSTKAKKYRAELNQYNRKKGTYGNNDGKDASHKGGKIVGFEKESTNRGRREKSRLKKEDIREDIGLDVYLGGIIKAMRKSRLKPKTAKVMKHGFSKSKDKIGFFIDVEKREIEGKKLWTLQFEVDRDGYLWYLSAPRDIKIGKWADTSQLVRGFKKLDRLPGFGQDAIFKRRR